ncbi:MAG: hypothetical protein ACLRPC_01580 [Streptococcus sp.]
MKYAKHGLALLFLLYLFVFGIEGLGIYLTGVFNGDLSFLYFILFDSLLFCFSLAFFIVVQKTEDSHSFQYTEMEVALSGVFALVLFVVLLFVERWVSRNSSRLAGSRHVLSNRIAILHLSKWPWYFWVLCFCPSNCYISYDRRIYFLEAI